jgi:hypothetical protein
MHICMKKMRLIRILLADFVLAMMAAPPLMGGSDFIVTL